MVVGIYSFELHLPASRSLKDKRQVVQRLKDRLRSRHNLALSECEEHADLWQRAALVLVSIATRRDVLARLFEAVRRDAEQWVPGDFVERASEFLDIAEIDTAYGGSDAP